MQIFKREVIEDMRIPTGYGLSYWDQVRDFAVVHIIPLNLIIAIIRNFYYFLLKGWYPHSFDKLLRDSYHKGYTEGVNSNCKNKLSFTAGKMFEEGYKTALDTYEHRTDDEKTFGKWYWNRFEESYEEEKTRPPEED